MTDTAHTTQVYQVLIKAKPQQFWDAITKPEFTSRYFHGARVDTTGEAGTPMVRWRSAQSVSGLGRLTVLNGLKTLFETGTPLFEEAS
jgi:uncharacterized protein YndB with AHSA1/START domain